MGVLAFGVSEPAGATWSSVSSSTGATQVVPVDCTPLPPGDGLSVTPAVGYLADEYFAEWTEPPACPAIGAYWRLNGGTPHYLALGRGSRSIRLSLGSALPGVNRVSVVREGSDGRLSASASSTFMFDLSAAVAQQRMIESMSPRIPFAARLPERVRDVFRPIRQPRRPAPPEGPRPENEWRNAYLMIGFARDRVTALNRTVWDRTRRAIEREASRNERIAARAEAKFRRKLNAAGVVAKTWLAPAVEYIKAR